MARMLFLVLPCLVAAEPQSLRGSDMPRKLFDEVACTGSGGLSQDAPKLEQVIRQALLGLGLVLRWPCSHFIPGPNVERSLHSAIPKQCILTGPHPIHEEIGIESVEHLNLSESELRNGKPYNLQPLTSAGRSFLLRGPGACRELLAPRPEL